MDVCASSSDNELSNDCDIQAKYKNNAANYLTVNEKGKFKWIGPFEEIKSLMNELTEKDLKWTSPGGHCKLLELDEAEIRWYSNNKSLTISGKASDDIKSQLRILADLSRADTEVTDEGNSNGKDAVIDNTNGEAPEGANNNVKDDVVDNNMTNDRFRETLNSTVRELEVSLERKINELASEINETRIDLYNEKMIRGENEVRNESINNEQSSNLKGFLAKQNDSLKKENDQLKASFGVVFCIKSQGIFV
jgi:hypothetical protein